MFDVILILGGGVREGGILPPWAAARFDRALELHGGEPLVCLSAATTHRPPPLEDGFPISESLAGARYLMSKGVPARLIRIENMSLETIGNAYLSKLLHVDPAGWRRLLVVTSAFHMPRSRAIFEWVYGMEPNRYELEFAFAPDSGISPEGLRFRREREARSLESLRRVQTQICTPAQLHEWFFLDHHAYNAEAGWRQQRSTDPQLLESY